MQKISDAFGRLSDIPRLVVGVTVIGIFALAVSIGAVEVISTLCGEPSIWRMV